MSGEHLSRQPTAPTFDRLENFYFLVSRQDPSVRSRQYSFDADSAGLAPFTNLNMDYDQTEGMGGLSVSSYDSVEDDRSSFDVRGYPYHGKFMLHSAALLRHFHAVWPVSSCVCR